ncbi:MAG: hypothetical protein P9L99_07325 [Candidatus Lernaella stagnicola]|nr:hypothetical protein [Candidatus Lernaella stagnicola]
MKSSFYWMIALFVSLLLVMPLLTACDDDDDDDDDAADDDATDDDMADDDTAADDDDDDNDDDDDTPPPIYNEDCAEGPVLAFNFSTSPMIVPYPNDLYTVPDASTLSGHRVKVDGNLPAPFGAMAGLGVLKFVTDPMNTLDGFSTLADLYVPTGTESRPASWPDEFDPAVADSIFLMVDDPESEFDGEMAPVTAELRAGAVQLRPFKPLREHTHYVLVVTRALKPKGDECYQAGPTMRRIWDEFYGYESPEIGDRYGNALATLEELGLALDRILAIADFTTLYATKDLAGIREQMDDLLSSHPPTVDNWQYVNNSQPGLEGYLFADMDTPKFQNQFGEWERDGKGGIVLQGWEDVELLISLPDPSTSDFQQPYPLVIHGHGVGGFKDQITSISSEFADAGFAMIAIDAVCHGPRAPIPYNPTASLMCYFDFLHPLTFRDNFRETMANHLWLSRAIKEALGNVDKIPYPNGDGVPDFDLENIYYASVSLGSIHGGIYAAIEDQVDAYVLSSAGAKFIGIALEGPYMGSFVDIAELLDQMLPDLHATDAVWMLGHMAQHILDAADPANYLMHVMEDPLLEDHTPWILQQSSSDDFMLGGLSGAYFARAAGYPQFNPYVWDAGVPHADLPYTGSGFYQYDTDEHFFFWMDTGLGPAYREQGLHYLRTHKESGEAEVIDPLAR